MESIGWGVTSEDASLDTGLPTIQKTLNWVRLAQRFPVRILLDNPPDNLMRIGATAVVVVHCEAPSRKQLIYLVTLGGLMMQMLQLLRTELAPKPGRLENVLRITVLTVILVILLETFQTPLPAYSAYHFIFYIKRRSSFNAIYRDNGRFVDYCIGILDNCHLYDLSR